MFRFFGILGWGFWCQPWFNTPLIYVFCLDGEFLDARAVECAGGVAAPQISKTYELTLTTLKGQHAECRSK